jgi:predicted HTH transcriptional regulator
LENLTNLLYELIKLPKETEWLEFKKNYADSEEIGEYISALSNSATYHDRSNSYLIWGVDNDTHEVVGTEFNFSDAKVGNEELENWLRRLLSDNANFSVSSIMIGSKRVIILVIFAAAYRTVRFKNVDYIRVGSYKKKLRDYPPMEVQLWQKIGGAIFEELLAKQELQFTEVFSLLDYPRYFDLTETATPGSMDEMLHYLIEDRIVAKQDNGLYAITNMGALLFAKDLASFSSVSRKYVRVIQHKGIDRINTIREEVYNKGYASGFEDLLKYVEGLLPKSEEIEGAFRSDKIVYPSIAVRELISNSLIHQNMSVTGAGPTIEIFDNRIEITNPGTPLIEVDRFIDNPPRSRNEVMASLMRRMHICEERGIGWDRIALSCERHHLPAPRIDIYSDSTKVTLFSHIPFRNIPINEKKWACYMHACLKQVSGEQMTNASLRDRFGIAEHNKALISRLISASVDDGLIKLLDTNTAPRYYRYVPFWA